MSLWLQERRRRRRFSERATTVFEALVIALVIRSFLFQPFNIPSGSMEPTLLIGDYLFASKFSYGFSHAASRYCILQKNTLRPTGRVAIWARCIQAGQYRESHSAVARLHQSQTRGHLDFTMLSKQTLPAIAAILGVAVSASWAVPALAAPAQSTSTTQSRSAPLLHGGDLVRLRSGGPVLTVKSVRDGWVICTWLTDYGELQSGGFPIAMVEGPVTPPPDDVNAETNGLSQE